jgi:uncharacterized membrane protein
MTPAPGHRARTAHHFGKNRIEALADGIFAVAMTLLVLDVKLPGDELFTSSAGLLARLLSVEHTYVIYLISFVVLGMFWVVHHAQFHFVRSVDHTLLWINLAFLFVVTAVPFSTDLLGDHHNLRLPYLIYGFALLALASLLMLQVAYLRRHRELAEPALTREVGRRIVRRVGLFALVPLISMAAVFYNTHLALYLYFLLPIAHFLPGRIDAVVPPAGDDA